MKIFKRIIKFTWIWILSFVLPNKAKSNVLSDVDKRIENVRKNIKHELKNKEAKDISIPFKDYTANNNWINWGNWGNWNNWNNWSNWAKWNDWNNWAKWGDWNNWRNY